MHRFEGESLILTSSDAVIISIFPTLSDARTCHYQYVTQYVAHLRLARHSPNPKTTHMSDYQADVAGSQVAEPALCDPFLTLQSGFLLAVQFEVAVLIPRDPKEALLHGTGGVLGHSILSPGLELGPTTPNTARLPNKAIKCCSALEASEPHPRRMLEDTLGQRGGTAIGQQHPENCAAS